MIFLKRYKKYAFAYYKHKHKNDFDNKQLHLHDHLLGFHVRLIASSCYYICVNFSYYRITIEITYFDVCMETFYELHNYIDVEFPSGRKITFTGFEFCECVYIDQSLCYFHNRILNSQYNKEHAIYRIPFEELPRMTYI